ncbi:glycoside hydrolase family 25 protein [Tenuifilum sp.]|uniref:glycoside hydrolase family 25 protein n=1 Tax=Tenuifilum sp. TaxID=2760880 RepID=UPI001B5FB52A|nr:lysozyme [Bacteroidales bacterium]HOK61752.1 GH25 family lysozyme [Tenuifilum sp.]MBP9030267.1 lysozyme [Bacteroidales bacterium]HOK86395.1 GH25 family lysozyme [Tenuifilum sp.]HPP90687.1 GH25 family lysozyme [Tenuifilum sp.]
MKKKKRNNQYILPVALFIGALAVWIIVRFISDPHHRYLIWGIDVSAHTGKIDWEKVKDHKVDFAFIKASEGATLKDKSFRNNVTRAREAGIPVGAYHFFNFNRRGIAQAQNFLRAIDGVELDLPPVVDVEEWGNVVRRPRKQIIADLVDFVELVEKTTGQKVLIYTNKDTFKWYISETFPDHDIWICSFDHTPEIEKSWTFWQYHHEGRLKGVQGKVDFNVFYGNTIEWKNYLNNKKR